MDHVSAARAVFDATAEAYADFVGTELSGATEGPVDMEMLADFVELVGAHPANRVADVGCGPGRVAAFLAVRGIEVVGIDVSPAMLAVALNAHPGILFEEGTLTALPISDRSLAGAVCWYSVIYTPPGHLDDVFTELVRTIAPDGWLLVAFQAGNGEGVHRDNAFGSTTPLTSYRHAPDDMVRRLTKVGLQVGRRETREPAFAHETTPQSFILARSAALLR